MPDTRQPSTITIDEFAEVCELGETDDEKLARYWAYQREIARNIEKLVGRGARIEAGEYFSYGVALVIRAAQSVAETAR